MFYTLIEQWFLTSQSAKVMKMALKTIITENYFYTKQPKPTLNPEP